MGWRKKEKGGGTAIGNGSERSGNLVKMAISTVWPFLWPLKHFVMADMPKPRPCRLRATEGKYEGHF
ncbi:hypothetical protein BBC27_12060 [Acidithiobacillus ferrivorans]|uniref:Uncharacterized protein n=1 Tax=Acidithiobacillus ferrivorans TaxID=160808 RepID=A0A1B9BY62_9PROT|nr:hypothetical protein BBC27_12060 [Acidithiobacillus ferrivorans]